MSIRWALRLEYSHTEGQPPPNDGRRIHVRCGDCGQRVVETGDGDIRCPDAAVGLGACGNDPLSAERADGPLWAEALRGGRQIRAALVAHGPWWVGDPMRIRHQQDGRAYPYERWHGIPAGWLLWLGGRGQ